MHRARRRPGTVVVIDIAPLFRLDGRVAIITGASSGIGAEAAETLAVAGADVVVAARRPDRLAATAERVRAAGRRALAMPTDVADAQACTALVEATVSEFGRLDVLVAAAGTSHSIAALDDDPAGVEALLATNLGGAHHLAVAAARAMVAGGRGGSIVLVSSAVANVSWGVPQAAYAASKSGLHGMTRDLATQWSGRHGIRVNSLAPGLVATEMTTRLTDNPAAVAAVSARIPAGRIARVEEMSGPILFLASDASSYVTGATLCADGGWSAGAI